MAKHICFALGLAQGAKMKAISLPLAVSPLLLALVIWSESGDSRETEQAPSLPEPAQLLFAASFSCSPRKTCKKIYSCEEAMWLLHNCSWGGKLDRDNDGIPCEGTC